jgi:hypothetical protein
VRYAIGGWKMGVERIRSTVGVRHGVTAIAIVALGGTLDVLSTIVGHTAVAGVEEWNVAILTVAAWVPFPIAVVLTKVGALAVFAVGGFVVWKRDGPWELVLIGPGALWTGVGLLNAVTILTAL